MPSFRWLALRSRANVDRSSSMTGYQGLLGSSSITDLIQQDYLQSCNGSGIFGSSTTQLGS